MTPERWQRLKDIFGRAAELPAQQRDAFLRDACGEDRELAEEAQRLLRNHEEQSFLSSPPLGVAAPRENQLPLFRPEQVLANRFRIVRCIARGGMGEVYEADDVTLGSRVALKTIHPNLMSPDARELFRQEILMARRVTHPNVCRVYDAVEHREPGTSEPVMLFTMELLDGPTLSRYVREHGPFPLDQALPLIKQISAGLQAAHETGLVHGDFKCSNVMLVSTPNGFRPVITDFGLAAPAGSVHPNLRGTPGFMAPEQLRGEPVTPATDVFAVGALIRQVAQIRPRDSKWLAVVNRCLQPEPGKRYANVTDVVAALTTSRPWSPVVLAGAVGGLLLLVAVLKTPPSEAPVIAFIEPFSEPPEIAQPGPPSLPVALGVMPIPSQAAPIPPPNPTDKAVDRLLWDGAFQSAGSISADGKLFAYTDPSTGNLAIRDLATGQSRLLTRKPSDGEGSRAAARESILSPDKKYVVFHWFEGFVANSGRQVRSEIKLASLDKPEGDPRTLLLATTQALIRPYLWSPDSKRVLINQSFSVNNHQLAWLSVADGNLTALKTLTGAPRGVSLSPDGRYLAYDEGGDIRIRDLTTDDDEAIVEGPSMDTSPVWSSDGRSLLFTSARSGPPSLWRIAVDSGTRAGPEELVKANSPGVLGITPSGGLYYVAGGSRQNIFIAGTGAPALAVTQFVGSNFDSSWSPNGEMLAYKSARARDGLRSLVILPWGSQQEHVVPTNIQYVDTPIVWFPDGKSLLMAGRLLPMGRGGEGLYRVDADSGQVQLVKSGIPNFYVLTRDGKAIYLTRSNPETRDSEGIIERFEVETGVSTVFKRYSTKGHRFGSMALSPDGTRLAVLSEHNASAETSLEVYPLDGGDAQEVYKGPMNRTPGNGGLAWSGDQTHILFVHAEANGISMDVSIWKAPLNGGVAEPAGVTIPSLNARALSGLSRRPGSDSFTYTKFETFSELHVLENFLSSGK